MLRSFAETCHRGLFWRLSARRGWLMKIYAACRPERSALRMRLLQESLARSRRTPSMLPLPCHLREFLLDTYSHTLRVWRFFACNRSTYVVRCFPFMTRTGWKFRKVRGTGYGREFPAAASKRSRSRDPSTPRLRSCKSKTLSTCYAQEDRLYQSSSLSAASLSRNRKEKRHDPSEMKKQGF